MLFGPTFDTKYGLVHFIPPPDAIFYVILRDKNKSVILVGALTLITINFGQLNFCLLHFEKRGVYLRVRAGVCT